MQFDNGRAALRTKTEPGHSYWSTPVAVELGFFLELNGDCHIEEVALGIGAARAVVTSKQLLLLSCLETVHPQRRE